MSNIDKVDMPLVIAKFSKPEIAYITNNLNQKKVTLSVWFLLWRLVGLVKTPNPFHGFFVLFRYFASMSHVYFILNAVFDKHA